MASSSSSVWRHESFASLPEDASPRPKYLLNRSDKIRARKMGFRTASMQYTETRRLIKCLLKASLFINALMFAGMNNVVANIFTYLTWEAAAQLCINCANNNNDENDANSLFTLIIKNSVLLKTICVRNTRFPNDLLNSKANMMTRIKIAHLVSEIKSARDFLAEFRSISRSYLDWKFDTICMIPNVKRTSIGFSCSLSPDRIIFNPRYNIIAMQFSAKHIEIYRYLRILCYQVIIKMNVSCN